jgi:hypothetical protein
MEIRQGGTFSGASLVCVRAKSLQKFACSCAIALVMYRRENEKQLFRAVSRAAGFAHNRCVGLRIVQRWQAPVNRERKVLYLKMCGFSSTFQAKNVCTTTARRRIIVTS